MLHIPTEALSFPLGVKNLALEEITREVSIKMKTWTEWRKEQESVGI